MLVTERDSVNAKTVTSDVLAAPMPSANSSASTPAVTSVPLASRKLDLSLATRAVSRPRGRSCHAVYHEGDLSAICLLGGIVVDVFCAWQQTIRASSALSLSQTASRPSVTRLREKTVVRTVAFRVNARTRRRVA